MRWGTEIACPTAAGIIVSTAAGDPAPKAHYTRKAGALSDVPAFLHPQAQEYYPLGSIMSSPENPRAVRR